MEKTKMKVFEMCELKDSLMHWAREHKDSADIESMGQVVDMIKDLADAEKNCWKACYYETVVKAMKDADEEEKVMGRMGYDHWRYSSGRFAPAGRGHYTSGYTPTVDDRDMGMTDWDFQNPRMGYVDGTGSRSGNAGRSSRSGYDRYRRARMGYQSTGSAEDKEEMSSAAKEHVEEMAESIRDIWSDADPALRKELKAHMMSLIGEMS